MFGNAQTGNSFLAHSVVMNHFAPSYFNNSVPRGRLPEPVDEQLNTDYPVGKIPCIKLFVVSLSPRANGYGAYG